MTRNVISLIFDPAAPMVLQQAEEIDRLALLAPDYGVKLAIAVYQRRASSLATPLGLAAFSSWLQTAARRWPTITTWIAPNEPNQPRFWQPQFTPRCGNASGQSYFRAQATMYDALKTVNGDIETEFPLTVSGRVGMRRIRGTVGQGGRTLELETVNGSIRLRKQGST